MGSQRAAGHEATLVDEERLYFTEYDELHRPASPVVRIDSGAAVLIERSSIATRRQRRRRVESAARGGSDRNLIGQPVRHYDPSGRIETVTRDFKGNVLDTKQRLSKAPRASRCDWRPTLRACWRQKLSSGMRSTMRSIA